MKVHCPQKSRGTNLRVSRLNPLDPGLWLVIGWLSVITWPGYWSLIGWQWSRDLDTGLWLVDIDHVTWILASNWFWCLCKTLYAGLHPEHWGYCPVLRCLTLGPCDIWVPDILMPRSRVMEEMGDVELKVYPAMLLEDIRNVGIGGL